MEKIQESRDQGYIVVYRMEDHSIRAIRVNGEEAFLGIQVVGLEAELEGLILRSGRVMEYTTATLTTSGLAPFLDEEENREQREEYIDKFGPAFRAIFQENLELRKYGDSNLRDFKKYF